MTLASVALAVFTAWPALAGDLEDLSKPAPGRSRRATSSPADPNTNRDNRWVKPGATIVLADLAGPGVIRHMWVTFAEKSPGWLAKDGAADPAEIVLRIFWDDSKIPAVETPFGDFFAAGFGERAEVRSLPVEVEGGDAYNCFWVMPFRKHARIEIENQSSKDLAALYWNVDWTEEPVAADRPYFHARWRNEYPTVLGGDYVILDTGNDAGPGQYVGTVMSVRTRSPEWFGEGDETCFIDGETEPSIRGTGTEDYFLNAWGLESDQFPYYGTPILRGNWGEVGVLFCAYRWHVVDPIRFTKSLVVKIEHKGWMSADETASGKVEGFVEREDDFATVAFWYQTGPTREFAPLPPLAARRLPQIDRVIDGAAMLPRAKAGGGALSLQAGAQWTGAGQLFFTDDGNADAWVEVEFDVEKPEYRRFVLALTSSYDFGRWRVLLDGQEMSPGVDLYSRAVKVDEVAFGDKTLAAGKHVLRFECIGKSEESSGRRLGIDSIRLRERRIPQGGRK